MAKMGNKDVLKTVNYSLNIIKDIKAGKVFTDEEKEEILDKYVGLSEDNNSYWTPLPICKFIHNLITKDGDYCCDLAAGIGNFSRAVGDKKVRYDLYEFDENTSLAGQVAWSGKDWVNYIGNVDTLSLEIEPKYDICTINPPFTGSIKYENSKYEWYTDSKGKTKKKGSLGILDAFVEKAYKVTKDDGYIAMILKGGFVSNGNATEKLREWLAKRCDLKLLMNLDSTTFENAGILGTSVGTVLIVLKKGKDLNNKTIYAELNSKDNLFLQLNGIVSEFKKVQGQHYITYSSSYLDKGITGVINAGVDPEEIELDYITEEDKEIIGKCYCCNREIEEYELGEEIEDKLICIECDNDELTYIEKIKPLLGLEITAGDKKILPSLNRQREIKAQNDELEKCDKYCYFLSNSNGKFDDYLIKNSDIKFINMFNGRSEEDMGIIKCRYKYGVDNIIEVKDFYGYNWKIIYEGYKVSWEKVRKNSSEEWKDKCRKWHSGTIECSEPFYNTTFSFATYDDEPLTAVLERNYNAVYTNYDFICSYSYKLNELIKELIRERKIK